MKNHTPRYWGFRFGVEHGPEGTFKAALYPSTGRPVILPEAMSYGAAFQKANEFAQKLGEDYGQAISV